MRASIRTTKGQGKAWRLTILAAFAASLVLIALPSLAVHNDDFDLQGDVTTGGSQFDWDDFLEGEGGNPAGDVSEKAIPAGASAVGFIASGASPDHYGGGADLTTFTQGSKDTLNISDWVCTRSNNVGNKVDITNAYSTAQRNADGDLVIYFGTEIREPEGNSNVGMWFVKNEDVGCEAPATGKASTPFGGQHELGDVLVVSAFTNGGNTANISVYEWVGSGGSHGALDLAGEFADVACDTLGNVDDVACAIANEQNVTTPWHSPDKNDVDSPLLPNTFFEGGINITEVLATAGPEEECFTQFLANTRSSQSLTATIFDYTIDDLAICGNLTIVKETDPEATDQDFDFTVEGPSLATPDDDFTLNASAAATSSTTFTDLFAGEYTITEDLPEGGWDLIDITCVNGGDVPIGTVDLESGNVTVPVGAEGNVTCTFTNRQRGSVLFEKTYTVDPLEGEKAEFTLWHGDDVSGGPQSEPAEGGTVMDLTPLTIDDVDRDFYCTDELFVGDTYWIFETDTPTGFETVDPFSLDAEPGTCADRLLDAANESQATISNEPGPVDVAVTKFKLDTDVPLEGFEFQIFVGHDATPETDTAEDTQTTAGTGVETGVALFEDLEIGEYTVCETGQPSEYWSEADPQCQNVTLDLNDVDTVVSLSFENEPLSRIVVQFFDETGYTTASIDCGEDGSLPRTESGEGDEHAGDGELELDKLPLGEYDCTVVVENGAEHEESEE